MSCHWRGAPGHPREYGGGMAQLVDWEVAATTAQALRRAGPNVTLAEASAVVADLRRLTSQAAEQVAAFTGLSAQTEHPPVRVVDRVDWAGANIAGLRGVMDPLADQLTGDRRPAGLSV